MAVFGPQLIYTVIMFVLLTKLGKFYSFGRFILCHKLFRYLSPGVDELKKTVRTFYKSLNTKNKRLNRLFEIDDEKEEFNIPEGCTVELTMSPVLPYDLNYLKYTDDFQSFIDLSLAAIVIYATTEFYIGVIRPTDEINLSIVWCAAVLAYGVVTLGTITLNYLRTPEASLLYVFAALSFVLSLIVQLADTSFFDFRLKEAFQNVTRTSLEMIQESVAAATAASSSSSTNSETSSSSSSSSTTHKIYSQLKTYSTNELLFTCSIATISAIIGALLFFPAFRLARLHFLCLKYSSGSKLKRFLYYTNFFLPLAISLCWIKSTRLNQYATDLHQHQQQQNPENTTLNQFLSMVTSTTTTNDRISYLKQIQTQFSMLFLGLILSANLKLYLIISLVTLRLVLYRHYAQSYLNLAFEMAAAMRKHSQRITSTKYMKTISSVYQYYGVVASQYVIPLFVLLFLVFLLKTLGDFSWCGDWQACNRVVDDMHEFVKWMRPNMTATATSGTFTSSILKKFESDNFNVTRGHSVLNQIFTPMVFRSLIGYFTFWMCSIWFGISCFGLVYYQYIDKQFIVDD